MEFSAERDAVLLKELAQQAIYLGTSSWKYEGWLGQVYNADYSGARSPVNKKRFEKECLAEYATIFPTVCFDGGYWRFPDPALLTTYAEQLPENFAFAIKVTNTITERRDHAGNTNNSFLDARLFREAFLEAVQSSIREKLGPVIFEFSPFFFGRSFGQSDYSPDQFINDLDKFFYPLLQYDVKFAVEVRDPIILENKRYFDCLEYHGVAHVLNEQTWMPEIAEQIKIPGVLTAQHSVIRALVRPGVKHNDAVEEFGPYNRTKIELPLLREGIAQVIREVRQTRRALYAFINNRAEGNAPNTIASVLEQQLVIEALRHRKG